MTPFLIAQIVLTLFVFVMLLEFGGGDGLRRAQGRGAACSSGSGPYSVGSQGLLQPLADIIKLMFKEELRPGARPIALLFALAPIISATAAFAAFRGRAVRRRDDALRPARRAAAAAGRRRQRRGAGHLRDRLDERLRHRARRLELEQQSTRCSAACARRRR